MLLLPYSFSTPTQCVYLLYLLKSFTQIGKDSCWHEWT